MTARDMEPHARSIARWLEREYPLPPSHRVEWHYRPEPAIGDEHDAGFGAFLSPVRDNVRATQIVIALGWAEDEGLRPEEALFVLAEVMAHEWAHAHQWAAGEDYDEDKAAEWAENRVALAAIHAALNKEVRDAGR